MESSDLVFELVYTFDWYDGPRHGIANYLGQPHQFMSEWNDLEGLEESFLLSPITAETFALTVEDWEIWRRWETAFHQKQTSQETHPALPQDRERHEEIKQLLEGKLEMDSAKSLRKLAIFQPRKDPSWSGFGWQPLEVCWRDIV
ncbi:MAG: hypothetical protein ACO1RA_17940 [Planctomycetaceae bacterium]